MTMLHKMCKDVHRLDLFEIVQRCKGVLVGVMEFNIDTPLHVSYE